MDARSRRLALRAAARVALGGAFSVLAACGGQTVSGLAAETDRDEERDPEGPKGAGASAGNPVALASEPSAGIERATRRDSGSTDPGPARFTDAEVPFAQPGPPTVADAAVPFVQPGVPGAADAEVPGVEVGATPVPDGFACIGPVPFEPFAPPPAVTEGQFACCTDHVTAHLEDVPDAAVVNCCSAIVQVAGLGSALVGSPVRAFCCSDGLVAPQSEIWAAQFCAPWGPPVPPAMPSEVA